MSTPDRLRQATGTQVAVNPVAAFSQFLDRLKPQLALAIPKHLNSDRMARLALTAFSSNPDLQQCTHNSIAASIMTAAQLGLEPGVNGQGYLIPYKQTCTFVPGWKGLVDLVSRAGRATVWTGVVMPGDEFDYQLGDAPYCRHKPSGDGEGEWTHVYAIGRVRDAEMPVIEVWTRKKVDRHLAQYNKLGGRHYATKGENNFEMYGRKVALLQVLKYMPQSIEIANAVAVSDAADQGRGAIIDGDFVTIDTAPDAGSIDQETGEITDAKAKAEPSKDKAKPEVTGPTYAQLRDMLAKASNITSAAEVLDLGRALPDDQRKDLAAFFNERFGDKA